MTPRREEEVFSIDHKGYVIGPTGGEDKPYYEIFSPKVYLKEGKTARLIVLRFNKLILALFLDENQFLMSRDFYIGL